ncbi:HesB/IscA family protein [Candidatus Spongiihabitans sp.]|uniref:HesB/IscA family protein n=1 Tax=Candidatus Spongiihabitans sp. TaxID=3101308 RepID=UPI003C704171
MSEYNPILTESDLAVTETARNKIAGLINDTKGEVSAVRIYVSGGGCSGMNYGMTFAENGEVNDSTMTGENGFKLVVDPIALSFLGGAEIDYSDDGVNATFVFNNVFQSIGGSGSCGGCGGGAF